MQKQLMLNAWDMVPAVTGCTEEESDELSDWVERQGVRIKLEVRTVRGGKHLVAATIRAQGHVAYAIAASVPIALRRSFFMLKEGGIQ